MKTIKNIGTDNLEVPFEGYTYMLPKGKSVKVSDELFDFLNDRWPLAFASGAQLQKEKDIVEVKKTKTKSMFPVQSASSQIVGDSNNMRIQPPRETPTFGNPDMNLSEPDMTPPSGTTDADGVAWYGEGLQVEGGQA